jgi:ABC-type bacteriocin/lantibiotic exporter with double-glycine peptidase domain
MTTHTLRTHGSNRVRACVAALFAAATMTTLSACNVYSGSATTLQANELHQEAGWLYVEGVPELRQAHELDCGPTALAMVLGYYSAGNQERVLGELSAEQRASVAELRDLAKRYGFNAFIVQGKPEDLVYELRNHRPVIVGMAKPTTSGAVTHYEVVVGVNKDSQRIATLDPAVGLRQNSFTGFLSEWQATERVLLVVIPKGKNAAPPAEPTALLRH